MPSNEEKISELISSGSMGKIGNINVLPRKNDLPCHYIKGQNDDEKKKRKQVIIDMEKNINASFSDVSRVRVSKKRGHIVIDAIFSRARYVLKRMKNGEIYLITAFKVRERQLEKARKWENTIIVNTLDNLETLIMSI